MVKDMKGRPNLQEELNLWNKGFDYVVGIDEVGRGAFAGPVVAAGVIFSTSSIKTLRKHEILSTIRDSKQLSEKTRTKLSEYIKKSCLLYEISAVSVNVINNIGIGKATEKAIRSVIAKIRTKLSKPLFVLIDGFHIKYIKAVGLSNQKAIIKGDQKVISIAAASIIAKVYRDEIMDKLHRKYPVYGFLKNKGYGTKFHQEALQKYKFSKIHRTSFNLSKFLTEY